MGCAVRTTYPTTRTNGDVESGNGHLKNALDQRLRLWSSHSPDTPRTWSELHVGLQFGTLEWIYAKLQLL